MGPLRFHLGVAAFLSVLAGKQSSEFARLPPLRRAFSVPSCTKSPHAVTAGLRNGADAVENQSDARWPDTRTGNRRTRRFWRISISK